MTASWRVVKLGGSLLDWPELVPEFRRWAARPPKAANVVVVGGGALVDVVRQFDRQHALTPETSHWLSIRAMRLTAELFTTLLDEAKLVSNFEALQSSSKSVQVFEVEPFLRREAHSAGSLPCSWDVTSDSIAARLAAVIGASELVLLKSTLPVGPAPSWSQSGFVDPYFARAAAGLRVRAVNLRDADFPQVMADFGATT